MENRGKREVAETKAPTLGPAPIGASANLPARPNLLIPRDPAAGRRRRHHIAEYLLSGYTESTALPVRIKIASFGRNTYPTSAPAIVTTTLYPPN